MDLPAFYKELEMQINIETYQTRPRTYMRFVEQSGIIFMGKFYHHPALAELEGQLVSVHLTIYGPLVYQLEAHEERYVCTPTEQLWPFPTYMQSVLPTYARTYNLEA